MLGDCFVARHATYGGGLAPRNDGCFTLVHSFVTISSLITLLFYNINDIMYFMKLKIDKTVYPGNSIARQDGKVILTDEGLRGEEIEVIPHNEKKNYVEAETVKIITPSPYRVTARCDHYKICSPYQYIDYNHQVRIKEEQLREIFSDTIETDSPGFIFRPSQHIWHYRNKIDVHIVWEKGVPALAYNRKHSPTEFVKIDVCHLAAEEINELLNKLLPVLAKNKLKFVTDILIKKSAYTGKLLLVLYYDRLKHDTKVIESLLPITKTFLGLDGIFAVEKHTSAHRLLWGNAYLIFRSISPFFLCL